METIRNLNAKFTAPLHKIPDDILPLLARIAFMLVLLKYFWGSAMTKLGDGIGGIFALNPNAYFQMFPKAMEAANFDPSGLSVVHKLIAIAGTWGEFILPALIVLGLFSRLAGVGMAVFVAVQTYVDVTGHGADFGGWFNSQSGELIADQRLMWYLLFAILIVKGGGLLSVDRALKIN